MSENESLALILIAATAGGAFGAKRAESQPWRGAVIVVAALLVTGAISFAFGIANVAISIICNLIVAGLVGSFLGLTSRQVTVVVLGAILLSFAAGGVASLF